MLEKPVFMLNRMFKNGKLSPNKSNSNSNIPAKYFCSKNKTKKKNLNLILLK